MAAKLETCRTNNFPGKKDYEWNKQISNDCSNYGFYSNLSLHRGFHNE